tara:strand:+ start:765 stop:1670 length:906 start_codon:yes stop_codon:yes gene_type:complete
MNISDNNSCFKSFENIHQGETIYIIGNGPSLGETDLSLIENSPSIAMNRISLLYPKYNNWRPKYYIFCSTNLFNPIWGKDWVKSVSEAINCKNTISFIDKRSEEYLIKNNCDMNKNVKIMNNLTENRADKKGSIDSKSFSTNIVKSIDKTGTSMNVALQLAYFMGASKIIFLGTDLGWKATIGKKIDTNHFDKSYRENISNPVRENIKMRNVHILSRSIFKKNKPHVVFYNASKFSKLDVYPIIDYETFAKSGVIKENKEKLREAKEFWEKLRNENKYMLQFRKFKYRLKEKFFKFINKFN